MKIILCYKEFELGEMWKENDEYVFLPIAGCELAKQKYAIPRASLLLTGGEKRSKTLFGEYAYFITSVLRNSYVKSEANIIDGESDYEMLTKIARLNYPRTSFYLKNRR